MQDFIHKGMFLMKNVLYLNRTMTSQDWLCCYKLILGKISQILIAGNSIFSNIESIQPGFWKKYKDVSIKIFQWSWAHTTPYNIRKDMPLYVVL